MGSMQAYGYAELVAEGAIGLRMAVAAHMESNMYPPLPRAWVPMAMEAIEAASEGDWDREIILPEAVHYSEIVNGVQRDRVLSRQILSATEIVDKMRLEAFVRDDDFDGEEDDDND